MTESPSRTGKEVLSIPPSLLAVLGHLRRLALDQELYLVGGFVRDRLLGRESRDADLAVPLPALPLGRELALALGGHFVPLDEEHGVARVVLPQGWHLDLSTVSGDIDQDLARRDFTIDALALRVRDGTLLDPFGGRRDLGQRLVRAVGEGVFEADPLRLLRAVRLAAELDFCLDPATRQLMAQAAPKLIAMPGERVREELMRLLSTPRAAPYLYTLDELGILKVLSTELEGCRGVTQPPEHHWDVFRHSLETVAAAEEMIEQDSELSVYLGQEVAGFPRAALFKLGCLLHDLGKPQTRALDEEGRLRFLGHAQLGAEMATGIMRRLHFSARETGLMGLMITHHLRPTQMAQQGLPTPRAIYRFFRDTGEAGAEVLYLSLADHRATRGPNLDPGLWQEHLSIVKHILREGRRQQQPRPPRLLTGHDIMNTFGVPPGPQIGRFLELVQEAQAAGEIATPEEALALVKKELGR